MDRVAFAMLPTAVRWGFLLHMPIAFTAGLLLSLVPGALLLARARLGSADLHWTEKARRLAPVRIVLQLGQLFNPVFIGGIAYGWCGPLSLVSPKVDALLAILAAFGGAWWSAAIIGTRLLTLHDFPPPGRATTVLRLYLAAVPFVASYALVVFAQPKELLNAILLDAFALGLLVTSMVNGLTLRQWFGVVRPAQERLLRAIGVAASRMDVEPPNAYEAELQLANAYAMPFEKSIAFTTGALHILTDDEIASVASHEIAHLKQPRASHWMRLLTPAAFLVFLAVLARRTNVTTIAIGYVAVAGVWIAVNKQKRALEKGADDAGVRHQGDAGTYAMALLRIYRANLFLAATKRAGTHPMLYDRLIAAGVTPDFARPKPPILRAAWWTMALTALLLVVAGFYREGDDTPPSIWRLAVFGNNAHQLGLWANLARDHRDVRAEIDLLEASVDADPLDDERRLSVIRTLAAQDQCSRAAKLSRSDDAPRGAHFDREVAAALTACRNAP